MSTQSTYRFFLRFAGAGLIALTCATGSVHSQSVSPVTNLLGQNTTQKRSTQLPTNGSSTQTQERTPADIDEQIADIQKKQLAAQSELGKVQNQLKTLAVIDTEARAATQESISFWQQQIDFFSQSIDALKDLRRLTDKASELKKQKDNWRPPAGTPPWPLAVADEAQFGMMQWQYQVQHLTQRLTIIDQEINDQKKARAKYEVELRQVGDTPDLIAKTERVKRHLELNTISLSASLFDKDVVTTEKQIAQLHYAIQKQTWSYYNNRFIFSDEDLVKKQSSLEKEIITLRNQETQASAKINRTLDLVATAKIRLTQLESTPGTSPQTILNARREWRKADSQAEAARVEREKFRALIELTALQVQLWSIRHDIYSPNLTADGLNKMKDRQQALERRLDQGLQYLTQMIAEKSQSSFELSEQAKAAKDPSEKAFLLELMKPIAEQIDNARSLYLVLGRVRQLLEISQNEILSKESSRSLRQQISSIKSTAIEYVKAVWNYELFAIDDLIVVDGREVKTKRSVTVGKSIGAMLILIVGFMLISRLIKRTLAIAVNKAHLGASKSALIGRWLMFFAAITLIITAFNLVEIPLSAFAFFGGALAIGVGFGTQNILKNLISGVMLLIEKPIRIGDLVEIDGVTGVVTSIGIRFSTIHGAQGTDTLIPNSSLVEHKLVNWTYSTPDVRKEIKITVAYNSNIASVCEILHKVSLEHPAIMHTPTPLVTLEDFGDNGLLFNLQCWMKIQSGLVISQVLSELRMNILAAFNEAGIELPFPQRVVQFDTSQPLDINLKSQPGSQQA